MFFKKINPTVSQILLPCVCAKVWFLRASFSLKLQIEV